MFIIKEIKDSTQWISVIEDLSGNVMRGTFYEQELETTSQDTFRVEIK